MKYYIFAKKGSRERWLITDNSREFAELRAREFFASQFSKWELAKIADIGRGLLYEASENYKHE